MSSTIPLRTRAEDFLRSQADESVLVAAIVACVAGTHTWRFDEDVDGVVALVQVGSNQADIVIYAWEDFELSRQFEEKV